MIFFDLDGTLIDSNGVWIEVDEQFLGRYGFEVTEEYRHAVGHSIFPVAAQYTKEYCQLDLSVEEIMEQWMDLARDAYANHIPLKPGVREFLARKQAEGERMVILTACVPELCFSLLERHGLADTFETVIFAQDMGLEKKEPEVYLRAMEQMGVSPEESVFFEDGPGNCAAAKSVGMTVVGIYDPFYETQQEEMKELCHRYILSFEELL